MIGLSPIGAIPRIRKKQSKFLKPNLGLFQIVMSIFRSTSLHSALAILLFLCNEHLHANEDESVLKREFASEISSMKRKLEHPSFHVKCSVSRSSTEKGNSSRTKKEFEIACNGPLGLETGKTGKDGTGPGVYFKVKNESYAFAIEKNSGRTNLQYLERLGVDASVDKRVEGELSQGNFGLTMKSICGFMVNGEPLFDLIAQDGFSIKRLFGKDIEGKHLVHVDFEYLGFDSFHNDRYQLSEGLLICDPSNEWAVVETSWIYESLSDGAKGRLKFFREFQSNVGIVPMATKLTTTYESLDKNVGYRTETVWTNEIKRREIPKEEFYLSYYGLPEPNFGKSWLGSWGWWMFAGIVFISVGTIFIRRQRQT